ncbi:MAG: sulfite exporter TauE/SafE family protein [Candidatus Obscuribacterales bacterium]|nr:sulfite exporter TauE/SafE family protein [Candidatus Obscuribacterales bacterium]
MDFNIAVLLVSIIAGAVASVSGFGIGSLLTPLFATQMDTKIAVAAVSIPHLLGTALRAWVLRKNIDRKVLFSFGISSAIGGLSGAILHNLILAPALSTVFGCILIFAGFLGASGIGRRLEFKGWLSWTAGALSGLLGGLVGNQGGIRSAAMLAFPLPKESFVATATAIGIVVDLARIPVYLALEHKELGSQSAVLSIASLGVLCGTVLGMSFLQKLNEARFKQIVSGFILALGIYFLLKH